MIFPQNCCIYSHTICTFQNSVIWDSAKWQDTKLAVLSKSYAIQELNVTILLIAACAKLRHSICGKRSVNIPKSFAFFRIYTKFISTERVCKKYGKMSVNLRISLTVYSAHETIAFPARAKIR